MIDALASAIAWILQFLVTLLPESPVTSMIAGWGQSLVYMSMGLQTLNWFVDINGMIIMMGVWLIAVEMYCIAWFAVSTLDPLKEALGRILGAWTS